MQTDDRGHHYLPRRPQRPLSQLFIGSDAYNASTGQQEMDGVRRQKSNAEQQGQEEEDPRVGHGIGQPQDAAAHDGVAEVEH